MTTKNHLPLKKPFQFGRCFRVSVITTIFALLTIVVGLPIGGMMLLDDESTVSTPLRPTNSDSRGEPSLTSDLAVLGTKMMPLLIPGADPGRINISQQQFNKIALRAHRRWPWLNIRLIPVGDALQLTTSIRIDHPDLRELSILSFAKLKGYINSRITLGISIDSGRANPRFTEIRFGSVSIPDVLGDMVASLWLEHGRFSRTWKNISSRLSGVAGEPSGLTLSFGGNSPDGFETANQGFLRTLKVGEAGSATVQAQLSMTSDERKKLRMKSWREAIRGHLTETRLRLRAELKRLPEGNLRLVDLLHRSFKASDNVRTAETTIRAANAAAILTAAEAMGYPVKNDVGDLKGVESEGLLNGRLVLLRGRKDWSKHLIFSAVLTLHHGAKRAYDVGLEKEYSDLNGSGFSFTDLLADKAGIRLALAATSNEHSALRLRKLILSGLLEDDLMPDASDFPEGLTRHAFIEGYHNKDGSSGSTFLAHLDEMNRLLDFSVAYRK